MGQSISWPYPDELVGWISFSVEDKKLITAMNNIFKAVAVLELKDNFVIRKNIYEDQEQMAKIKVDGWKSAYDLIIAAVRGNEVLGYSCFNPIPI